MTVFKNIVTYNIILVKKPKIISVIHHRNAMNNIDLSTNSYFDIPITLTNLNSKKDKSFKLYFPNEKSLDMKKIQLHENIQNILGNNFKVWLKYGYIHRDYDLPSIVSEDVKFWYKYGDLFRNDDKPQIVRNNGSTFWYKLSKTKDYILHRNNDLPSIILYNDNKITIQEWYQNGVNDRDNDQPSIIYANGSKVWKNS